MNKKQIKVDILLKCTTPLVCKEGRKTISYGTGFFFEKNNQLYLVTNRHVFVNERKNYYPDNFDICLNVNNQQGKEQIVTTNHNLYKSKKDLKGKWLDINKDVDIAAYRINLGDNTIFSALKTVHLPPKEYYINLAERVLVIGYPRGFYDDQHNLPILRSANVASAYNVPFKGGSYFLIDCPLHPGTSGSPVITYPSSISENPGGGINIGSQKKFYLLGVNSGSFADLQLNAVWYSDLIDNLLSCDE